MRLTSWKWQPNELASRRQANRNYVSDQKPVWLEFRVGCRCCFGEMHASAIFHIGTTIDLMSDRRMAASQKFRTANEGKCIIQAGWNGDSTNNSWTCGGNGEMYGENKQNLLILFVFVTQSHFIDLIHTRISRQTEQNRRIIAIWHSKSILKPSMGVRSSSNCPKLTKIYWKHSKAHQSPAPQLY